MHLFSLLVAALLALLATTSPIEPHFDSVANSTILEKRTTSPKANYLCGDPWGYTPGGAYMLYQMWEQYIDWRPDYSFCVGAGPGTCRNVLSGEYLCGERAHLLMCNDNDHEVCLRHEEVYWRLMGGYVECSPGEPYDGDNTAMQVFYEDKTDFVIGECDE